MTPILQTRFGAHDGNCYAACIASVFDAPLEAVPWPTPEEMASFAAWQVYDARVAAQFLNPRGYYALSLTHNPDMFLPGYSLCGIDVGGGFIHSVVCHNSRIVWDPYPGGVSGEPRDWTIFVPLDPARTETVI